MVECLLRNTFLLQNTSVQHGPRNPRNLRKKPEPKNSGLGRIEFHLVSQVSPVRKSKNFGLGRVSDVFRFLHNLWQKHNMLKYGLQSNFVFRVPEKYFCLKVNTFDHAFSQLISDGTVGVCNQFYIGERKGKTLKIFCCHAHVCTLVVRRKRHFSRSHRHKES